MIKIATYLSLLVILHLSFADYILADDNDDSLRLATQRQYEVMGLEGKLDYTVFHEAINGMSQYDFENPDLLTIIDYTKPSHEERLFVIDLHSDSLLYHTLVAHGRNSGLFFAVRFSNRNRSLMSSPGFYSTAETYHGKHGYSLKLDGLEQGINDNARERLIVIHGAWYVSEDFIDKHSRIGRSWGCPALPLEITKEVIDLIKGGSCLYIHSIETYKDDEIDKN